MKFKKSILPLLLVSLMIITTACSKKNDSLSESDSIQDSRLEGNLIDDSSEEVTTPPETTTVQETTPPPQTTVPQATTAPVKKPASAQTTAPAPAKPVYDKAYYENMSLEEARQWEKDLPVDYILSEVKKRLVAQGFTYFFDHPTAIARGWTPQNHKVGMSYDSFSTFLTGIPKSCYVEQLSKTKSTPDGIIQDLVDLYIFLNRSYGMNTFYIEYLGVSAADPTNPASTGHVVPVNWWKCYEGTT